jgi:hypothetical protein
VGAVGRADLLRRAVTPKGAELAAVGVDELRDVHRLATTRGNADDLALFVGFFCVKAFVQHLSFRSIVSDARSRGIRGRPAASLNV